MTRIGKLLIAAVNLALIVLLLAFVVFSIYWNGATEWQLAEVRIVAPTIVEVRAPADGVFVATAPFVHGEIVEQNQVLGTVDAPWLAADLAAARSKLRSWQRRKLLLDRTDVPSDNLYAARDSEREFRECGVQIAEAMSELTRLEDLQRKLTIRSPIAGRVHLGATATKALKSNETILQIWPAKSGPAIEVDAPVAVVQSLVKEGIVRSTFLVAGNTWDVDAAPSSDSIRMHSVTSRGSQGNEIWATVLCRPNRLPDALSRPGLVGRLR